MTWVLVPLKFVEVSEHYSYFHPRKIHFVSVFGKYFGYFSHIWRLVYTKMIKLFSLKQEKKTGDSATSKHAKKSAAVLRVTKGKQSKNFWCPSWVLSPAIPDLNELNLPKTCATEFPDPDDLLNFKLIICPDEGFYKNGRFIFTFKVNSARFLVVCTANSLLGEPKLPS